MRLCAYNKDVKRKAHQKVREVKKMGYIGYSMSERAADAYDNDEMPKSNWTKKAILEAIADVLEDNDQADCLTVDDFAKVSKKELQFWFLRDTGWHHTSKYFNITYFYEINEDYICTITKDELEDLIKCK